MDDTIYRQAAIDAVEKHACNTQRILDALYVLPSAELEIAENLCLCKCYITGKDGFRHEVIYTDDIRRVTEWEI